MVWFLRNAVRTILAISIWQSGEFEVCCWTGWLYLAVLFNGTA